MSHHYTQARLISAVRFFIGMFSAPSAKVLLSHVCTTHDLSFKVSELTVSDLASKGMRALLEPNNNAYTA